MIWGKPELCTVCSGNCSKTCETKCPTIYSSINNHSLFTLYFFLEFEQHWRLRVCKEVILFAQRWITVTENCYLLIAYLPGLQLWWPRIHAVSDENSFGVCLSWLWGRRSVDLNEIQGQGTSYKEQVIYVGTTNVLNCEWNLCRIFACTCRWLLKQWEHSVTAVVPSVSLCHAAACSLFITLGSQSLRHLSGVHPRQPCRRLSPLFVQSQLQQPVSHFDLIHVHTVQPGLSLLFSLSSRSLTLIYAHPLQLGPSASFVRLSLLCCRLGLAMSHSSTVLAVRLALSLMHSLLSQSFFPSAKANLFSDWKYGFAPFRTCACKYVCAYALYAHI